MLTERDSQQFAHDWFDAWNRHDVNGILALFAESAETRSPLVARLAGNRQCLVRGKAALRLYFSSLLRLCADLRFEPIDCFIGTQSVVLHYTGWTCLRVAEVVEFDRQGKVARTTSHYSRGIPVQTGDRQSRSSNGAPAGCGKAETTNEVHKFREARRAKQAATV